VVVSGQDDARSWVPRQPSWWRLFALVAVAYGAGAEASYRWFGAINLGLAFYPSTGVTVAAVLLVARSRWWAVLAAATVSELSVSLLHGIEPVAALGYLVANLVEPVIAGLVFYSIALTRQHGPRLEDRRPFIQFVAAAVVAGPLVGGAIGAYVKWHESGQAYLTSWLAWWGGDGLGALAIGAPLVLFFGPRSRSFRSWELAAGTVAIAPVSYVAFWVFDFTPSLLVVPVLVWAVNRFGVVGVAAVSPMVCVAANVATANGRGVFIDASTTAQDRILLTQAYLLVIIVVAWMVAVLLGERADAVRQLTTATVEAATLRQSESFMRVLQNQMLAMPDDIEGLAVAANYVPAEHSMRFGGDWYDAISTPHGPVLVVGDVVGHGPSAAALMGQLRAASRAGALTTSDPAEIIAILHRFAMALPGAENTTVAVVAVAVDGHSLRYCLAGHPPPLLVTDSTAQWLDQALGPPLGLRLGSPPVSRSVRCRPGDRLIMYSDGLIERRGEPLDTGLDRLRAAALAHSGDLTSLGGHLLEATRPTIRTDDTVVLVAQINGGLPAADLGGSSSEASTPTATFHPGPGELARARRWAREHCEPPGSHDPQRVDDIVLAVSELVTNAFNHAAAPATITSEVTEALMRVTVTNPGHGALVVRPSDYSGQGGRGLRIVETISDSWGWHSRNGHTTVWFELTAAAATSAAT
jgi:integral membrane sensor domain MASE1/anti-sigma regulatory factor (Ser/Thr protein kinase)